jgi:transposase-like protein
MNMTAKKRRQFSPEQKVAILRRHLLEHVPISDLCDEYRLQPTVFYAWQRQLFENGGVVFERRTEGPAKQLTRQVSNLEEKLTTKNEVLAELMEEHLRLKKELGDV